MTSLISAIVGLIFGAGIAYGQFRRLSSDIESKADVRDVNNIGGLVRSSAEKSFRRERNIELAILALASEPAPTAVEIIAILKGE